VGARSLNASRQPFGFLRFHEESCGKGTQMLSARHARSSKLEAGAVPRRQTRNWEAKPSSGLSSKTTVNKFSWRIPVVPREAVASSRASQGKYTLS